MLLPSLLLSITAFVALLAVPKSQQVAFKKANIFTTTTFTGTTSLAPKAFLFQQEKYRTRDEVISFGDCYKNVLIINQSNLKCECFYYLTFYTLNVFCDRASKNSTRVDEAMCRLAIDIKKYHKSLRPRWTHT